MRCCHHVLLQISALLLHVGTLMTLSLLSVLCFCGRREEWCWSCCHRVPPVWSARHLLHECTVTCALQIVVGPGGQQPKELWRRGACLLLVWCSCGPAWPAHHVGAVIPVLLGSLCCCSLSLSCCVVERCVCGGWCSAPTRCCWEAVGCLGCDHCCAGPGTACISCGVCALHVFLRCALSSFGALDTG